MATTTLRLREYDDVAECCECVHWSDYDAPTLETVERTVRSFLASGDYSEGGSERFVEVWIGGHLHGTYTAPQIRRFRPRKPATA